MFKSIVKIAAVTILFSGIHSLLASRAAKKKAANVLGLRKRNAIYPTFYNVQSLITFGGLILYGKTLPDRQLYKISKPFSWAVIFVQLCFLLYLLNGAKQIGFVQFSGIYNLLKLLKGQPIIQPESEGQGPVIDVNGKIKATGPFRNSRHPLNFGMLPILWLMPRMTVNLITFNFIITVYLITGSIHEEKRLSEAYGAAYYEYQKSGINFFFPSLPNLVKFIKS